MQYNGIMSFWNAGTNEIEGIQNEVAEAALQEEQEFYSTSFRNLSRWKNREDHDSIVILSTRVIRAMNRYKQS
jgi:hypothetical protein